MARKIYSQEFKDATIKLILDNGYSQKEAAKNLGVPKSCIGRWLQEARPGDKKESVRTLKQSDLEELARLRKENARLTMERDILKKAAAFFARENQ